ncbi:helix-turn-helix transcriptional regulator [Ruminococcus sp.]|uniref:helix-turn-helix transcriptional regulator n=1 Tax=Ruminococcus sp. TaxID=41978 RepID=UPI0025E8F4F1|nr:helix-turn-helix transcriptional regulator [Ruminococcus sp.]MCR4638951.1 helix-turn-helix domain-containing protein [Ruminococcus sp.]
MKENAHEIIKEKRLELGLSQKQLADKAGLSHNTVYNLETNRVSTNLETYEKICKILGIKLSSLLE